MRGTSWPERVLRVLLTVAAALVATLIVAGIWLAMEYRFVLIEGVEVSPSTYARWAVAHVVIVPLVGAGLVLVSALDERRRGADR
jgi:hypothetical protein